MGSPDPPKIPKAPDPAKSYQAGIDVYLKNLPSILAAEQNSRTEYDPQRIQEQQQLQEQFGPTQYKQMLDAFNQIDPTYSANRELFANGVADQYKLGSQLAPDQQSEIEQDVRSAEAARGNIFGGAPAIAEAYALGDRGLALQQQRTQNMLAYLAAPTMAQQLSYVPPVSPDRSFSFVNPNAGYQGQQFALQNYQNILGATQLAGSGGGVNPWASAGAGALSGAGTGAAIGSIIPGIGTAIGAIAGGLIGGAGGYFSDERLKEDVEKVGETPTGINIYEFSYKGPKPRFRGVMAQEVERLIPDAVHTDPLTGFKKVDYFKVGIPMERVK